MGENWCAFCLAILKPISAEDALNQMGIIVPRHGVKRISKADKDRVAMEIIKLKEQGLTWRRIGEMYNTTECAVRLRARSYKIREKKLPRHRPKYSR